MTPTTFTGGVQASLAPWADAGGAWQALNAAYAAMFEPVYGIVSDQGSPDDPANYTAGWSTVLDPDACPAQFLPYCALFNGTVVAPGTDPATARAIIKAEAGFARGQPATIIAAAQRNLSATQSCVLLERTAGNGNSSDPYHFVLIVRPEEIVSLPALQAAVDAVRPAGVQWTLAQSDSTTWNQAVHTWAQETATWNQASTIDP